MDHVKLSFDHVVIDSITMTFPNHGLVGIYGKSGCGKTSLLYLLAGLLPCEGKIEREGDYSFIRQNNDLLGYLSVKDNLLSECCLMNKHYDPHYFHRLVEKLELSSLLKKYPHELSVGQAKRVSIARSLLRQVPILFCDEPTGALHQAQSHEVMTLLKEASQYALVIVVSHDVSLLRQYGDELYQLNKTLKRISHKDILDQKKWGKGTCKAHVHFVLSSLKYHKGRYTRLIVFQCFMMLLFLIMSTGLYSLHKTWHLILDGHPLKYINIVEEQCHKGLFLFECGDFPSEFNWYVMPKKTEHIHLVEGRFPIKKDEVLVSDTVNKKIISYELEGKHCFHVVGHYHEILGMKRVFVSQSFYQRYHYYSSSQHVIEGDYKVIRKKYPHVENEWELSQKSFQTLWTLASWVFMVFYLIALMISYLYFIIIKRSIYEERQRESAILLSVGVSIRKVIRLYKKEAFVVTLCTSLLTGAIYMDLFCVNALFHISDYCFHFSLYLLPMSYYVIITVIYMIISLTGRRSLSHEKIVSLLREDN